MGSPRRLILTVGVIVLLIAAIVLVNQKDTHDDTKSPAATDPLSPEIPRSREGAAKAASGIATVLGSEKMYSEQERHEVLQAVADPDTRAALIKSYDGSYTAAFNRKIGLDEHGQPPAGMKFVSRTMPAETTVQNYSQQTATVAVWCSGLFGLTGKGDKPEIPVETGWFTMTISLVWSDDGWKLLEAEQTDGPEPTDR